MSLEILYQFEGMSIILGKFKNKRKLGKGAYGDVLLVEDPDGKQLALKMISKKVLSKDPFMEEYIQGEKQCMMSVKSPYIMELYSVQEDENYKYFVCEYCDGGDLLNYQAKQQKKVFTIKNATKILSQVILGLELLHKVGYLHRDIKPQNILLKKTNDGSTYQFKLADFGFAKRNQDVGGTVLGTQNYMSPEIYQNQIYSYEVDMWAFGVLLYFMLNMEFPFRLNPHASLEQKRQDLIKQSQKFSYSETVKKSKKKIIQNCTPQIQDLFKKMFNPDGQKRITFFEIREHPLFKDYFPNIDNQSRILYGKKKTLNRYDSFVQGKLSTIQPKVNKNPQKAPEKFQSQNIDPTQNFKKPKTTEEKEMLEYEYEKIKFLYNSEEQLTVNLPFLDPAQLLAFRYNVLKYYVMLLRFFLSSLRPQYYEKKYPQYKWKDFFKTQQFNIIKKQARDEIDQVQLKVSQTYDLCRNSLAALKKFNPKIDLVLEPEITEQYFDGKFKQAYRISTMGIYAKVREKFSNGNRYVYLTLLITLCHCYNQIMEASEQELQQIFYQFLKQRKSQNKFVDFGQLKSWLSQSEKQKLKGVIKQLLNKYFS